jgi:formylmethanofuran dehydrogenase subunit E
MSEFKHMQIKSTWPRCKKCGDAYFEHDWKYIVSNNIEEDTRVCIPCFEAKWWKVL